MKAYGVSKKDGPKDCTDKGKYGNTKIVGNGCACGKKHGKSSPDHKSRKAKMRKTKIDYGN